MGKLDKTCMEVLEKTEWAAIVTWSEGSPHVVGTWGDYIRKAGVIDDEIILIPAGQYHKTEENLKKNKNLQLLVASRKVEGSYGPGQGTVIHGEGEIQTEGKFVSQVKEKFSWVRGVLVVRVKEVEALL